MSKKFYSHYFLCPCLSLLLFIIYIFVLLFLELLSCVALVRFIKIKILYILLSILGYNTDIVCLQEVDKKGFTAELLQPMDFLGFTGFLKTKGTSNCEGPAIFINRDKFRYADYELFFMS